ncbi:SH3 domain protein [Trypanosoma cruzi]|nr:SH3 domain protein [Trypanosoma cruzi]
MLIAITTDPNISRPPHFVPAFTWPFSRPTRSRGWLGLSWIDGEPDHHNSDLCGANCVVFIETRLLHATCAPKGASRTTDERQVTAKGLLAAYEGGGKQPHPFHHHLSAHKASHRAADTSSDLSNRPNQSTRRAMELIRQRCSTVVRRTSDIPALGQLYEESERGGSVSVCAVNVGAENFPGGAIYNLLLDARTADQRGELRGLLAAIFVAPSTRRQHARMLRSMLEMNRTPLDMMVLGLKEIAARTETRQTHPLTEDEMNRYICGRTDWRERVVFRLAWITASRWSDIAALTPNNFTLERDGTVILDCSVAPKTARADPHRASRFVRIRE